MRFNSPARSSALTKSRKESKAIPREANVKPNAGQSRENWENQSAFALKIPDASQSPRSGLINDHFSALVVAAFIC
jgi:hypothetical protein